jgi:hypothetical protein
LFDAASTFLNSVDLGEPPGPDVLGDGPIYLDELATTYLTTSNLLEYVPRLVDDAIIHPESFEQAAGLVATEADAAIALRVLSRLRTWLRDVIGSSKISILPSDPAADRSDFPIPALRQLILNFGRLRMMIFTLTKGFQPSRPRQLARQPYATRSRNMRVSHMQRGTTAVFCASIIQPWSKVNETQVQEVSQVLTRASRDGWFWRVSFGHILCKP